MIVSIFAGAQLLARQNCRPATLPDGAPGVVHGGLAFALEPGDRIDITGPGFPPGVPAAARPIPGGFALVAGGEEAHVLLSGSVADCETAAADLKRAGFRVLRTGLYLGDPVDGIDADWFVKVAVPPAEGDLREKLARALNRLASPQGDGAGLRLRLLGDELLSAREKIVRDAAEIERLKLLLAERAATQGEADRLRAEAAEERRLREAAESDAREVVAWVTQEQAAAQRSTAPAAPADRPRRTLESEVAAVIEALLPRVRLLRNTLQAVTIEFSDRRGFYRALSELHQPSQGIPPSWKALKGLEGWLERHLSTGQNDAGRVYARLDRSDRSWAVLVGDKREQERDIAWLLKQ